MKLIIQGEMTDLNTYINSERRNRFIAAKIKKEETERVFWECRSQKLSLITKPSYFIFTWFLKDKRKDPDNVSSLGRKFILDGLVRAGILFDDGQEYVKGFVDVFKIDKEHPRVEITTKLHLPQTIT